MDVSRFVYVGAPLHPNSTTKSIYLSYSANGQPNTCQRENRQRQSYFVAKLVFLERCLISVERSSHGCYFNLSFSSDGYISQIRGCDCWLINFYRERKAEGRRSSVSKDYLVD